MSKLVEDIHDVLRDRVSNSFKVSYEYPGYVLVSDGVRGVAVGDVDGYVGWNTLEGESDSDSYLIDETLSVDVIVDELVSQIDNFKYFKTKLGGN